MVWLNLKSKVFKFAALNVNALFQFIECIGSGEKTVYRKMFDPLEQFARGKTASIATWCISSF